MKLRLRYIAAASAPLLLGGALLMATAGPALAADTDTFTISGGTLTVATAGSLNLTTQQTGGAIAPGTLAVVGALGVVTVTDGRGDTLDYNVTVGSTAFVGAISGAADDASSPGGVDYADGGFTNTGTVTPAATAGTSIDTAPVAVVAATGVDGVNTVAWNPTLTVNMPADGLADTYTATVTTSVL